MTDVRSPAMKEQDYKVKKRVQRGLVFLREKYGEDWVDHIDLETLDLTNSSSCVLGQVHPVYRNSEDYKGYNDAVREFFDGYDDDTIKYGFCAEHNGWGRLQQEWEKVIPDEKRRIARLRQAGLMDAVASD